MKHLEDLTAYKGVLPYASEIFGVYQPLLGWKSRRVSGRVEKGADSRAAEFARRIYETVLPEYEALVNPGDPVIKVGKVAPGRQQHEQEYNSLVAAEIARGLPSRSGALTPKMWDEVLESKSLERVLQEKIAPHAVKIYHEAVMAPPEQSHRVLRRRKLGDRAKVSATMAPPEAAARHFLEYESRTAGVLRVLRETGQYQLLNKIFRRDRGSRQGNALLEAARTIYDPFATIDPKSELDRVGLSPVGIAHLFREYFFELDTMLGPPVGHVWLSPGATVELVEVHTRRVLVEQTLEQSIESIHKSEKSLTQQDELSDAIKDENRSDTKLGVNVTSNQNWGWGGASESASFDLSNTQQKAREQTHKTMRQQSDKISSEIKQNFKTTFRTVTETTDMSSKRYLLANATEKLINYELRRKYRQIAVQVQDIGSYLCWQTYVDDPGGDLRLARLVHVGAPPDLAKIPPPEMVVPAQGFSEDVTITIPFVNADNASNDDTFDDGSETSIGFADKVNHIHADIQQGPVRCSQAGFHLASVGVDAQGQDAVLTVDKASIQEVKDSPGAYTFVVHLNHINFHERDSITAKATLHWEPEVDKDAISDANAKKLAAFTAKAEQEFRKVFMDEARQRIKLASNLQPRRAEDLREEERVVIYRALIQNMLAPESIIPQPDPQTQHVVAELLNSIFDVNKLLYFVAPEWWRPRLHTSQQQLGGLDAVTNPATGEEIVANPIPPVQDLFAWGQVDRADNYYVTEESKPAPLGSSLGWLLQIDGDDMRNAFLNAPWVKVVLPIRPGREKAALNWLKQIEGTDGIGPGDLYDGPEPEWRGKKTIFAVLAILAESVRAKHEESIQTKTFDDPIDDANSVHATPVDRVFEHGFDPLKGGFRSNVGENFEIFDQWIEVLPTDQVAAVEVTYDPKTGRQT